MGQAGGHQVTVIYSAECVSAQKASKPIAVLPLLVILFVVSYVILTMLVFEQGQTIESQRALIRELFRDSTELSSIKQGQIAKKNSEMRAQAPSAQVQSNQVQTKQTPSTQAQEDQAPYSQALPQHQSQKQGQKPQFQMPSRPASDLMDQNRAVITL